MEVLRLPLPISRAVLVMESRAFPDFIQLFNSKQQIREDLSYHEGFKSIIAGLQKLDSLLIQDKDLGDKLDQMPGVLSVHQTGDRQFQPLLVLQSDGRLSHKDILRLGAKLTGFTGDQDEKNYSRSFAKNNNPPG